MAEVCMHETADAHPGEEVCSKSVDGVIGQLDSFFIMLELEQGHSRPKCFLLIDLQQPTRFFNTGVQGVHAESEIFSRLAMIEGNMLRTSGRLSNRCIRPRMLAAGSAVDV